MLLHFQERERERRGSKENRGVQGKKVSGFRANQVRLGVRERVDDGLGEKGLVALKGTEGREKQEADKYRRGGTAALPDG